MFGYWTVFTNLNYGLPKNMQDWSYQVSLMKAIITTTISDCVILIHWILFADLFFI